LLGKPQLDGTCLQQFPYSGEPELVMDILNHGADVEVLTPESLPRTVDAPLASDARLYTH